MIEVKARILQRPVFITGESVECEISITNNGKKKKKVSGAGRSCDDDMPDVPDAVTRSLSNECDEEENVTLAWASAQVYCHCLLNERHMKLPTNMKNYYNRQSSGSKFGTSFSPVMGEKGHCLCSTAASVLFCDLKLKKGENKKFLYSQLLPNDLPPSYKGLNIKLSYKVCIGIGRIGKSLSMIRLPFRLYEIKGIFKSLKEKSQETEEPTPPTPPPPPPPPTTTTTTTTTTDSNNGSR
jgi:hypothetical protein